MAESGGDVRPFRGLYYDPKVAGYLDALVAPPPDRIDDGLALTLASRSPYNVVHLVSGSAAPGDTVDQNRYTRARSLLLEWSRAGILKREGEPMFYLHEQEHGSHTRYALVALLRLPEAVTGPDGASGGPGPSSRRRQPSPEDKLIAACHAHLCPVPTLWEDPSGDIWDLLDRMHYDADDQRCEIRDDGGVLHRFKAIHGAHYADAVRKVTEGADGKVVGGAGERARWEAALHYRDHARRECPDLHDGSPECFALVAILSAKDPGLGAVEPELRPPLVAGLVMNRIDLEAL